MLNRVQTFFKAPIFADEDKTRKARYANAIAIAFLVITLVYEAGIRLFMHYEDFSIVDLMIFALTVTCLAVLVLLKRGYVNASSILLIVFVWIVTNGIAATGYGARDSSFITNFTIILMAALLLSWQASLFVTALSIASGFALAYAEQTGLISHGAYPITSFASDIAFVFGVNWVVIYLLTDGLEHALRKSRGNFQQLEVANRDLSQTQDELQHLTSELTITNQQLQNRTEKLRAIAAITSTAASIHSFDTLISSVSRIVSAQLGYYQVGVFLLDEQRQYAILRSANSEAGLTMLARGYRLHLGQNSLVTTAAQTGKPQVTATAEDGKSSTENTEFAGTRSELALPLKSADEVIGVLDLHSMEPNAFSTSEVSTLSILADQIGIAIQNALIYEQSERALREANVSFTKESEKEWKKYAEAVQTRGYRYDGIKPEPVKEVNRSGKETNAIYIPVQLRGQTIGQLKLKASDSARQWTEDELAMAEATAERAALALEGARLLEEAQQRAAREAFLAEMGSKLSTSFQVDSILRDTVEELGQTLRGSIVSFQLVNPSVPLKAEKE